MKTISIASALKNNVTYKIKYLVWNKSGSQLYYNVLHSLATKTSALDTINDVLRKK